MQPSMVQNLLPSEPSALELCHPKSPGRNVAMVGLGMGPRANFPLSLPSLSKHQDGRTDVDSDLSRIPPAFGGMLIRVHRQLMLPMPGDYMLMISWRNAQLLRDDSGYNSVSKQEGRLSLSIRHLNFTTDPGTSDHSGKGKRFCLPI